MIIHVVPPFSFSSVSPVDTTIKYGDEVHLDARGNAIAWLWLPITYLNDPTLQSPTARPLENMTYEVVGLDQYGCRDTATVHINVEYQSNPVIPNAFSPNGDGLNDVFSIQHLQFDKLLEFKVYNRTGQVVFETHNPKQGWDGSYNGKPAAMDTYFYLVKIVPPGEKAVTYKGDISLIR
jgi:gliding motility-associated-like protein